MRNWAIGAGIFSLLAAGCAPATFAGGEDAPAVTVRLMNPEGASVGSAVLADVEGGVRVNLNVQGLPAGVHGFHIHETGQCTPPDFTSAGGHYNPTGREHGTENPQGPHAGDLPNFTVGADGTGEIETIARGVTLRGANPLLKSGGTALVIHAGADDYRTNPSGNSGARIACGVISADE